MPEIPYTPPEIVQPQETSPAPEPHRVKRWSRVVAPAVLAATLAAGCAFPGNSEAEGPGNETAIVQNETRESRLPSVADTVHQIESSPSSSYLSGDYIHISSGLQSHYQESDFGEFKNYDVEGNAEPESWPSSSAPLLELRYDPARQQIVYENQAPDAIPDVDLHRLLEPIYQDPLLQTAFSSGSLNRFVIRLTQNDTTPYGEENTMWHGEYKSNDRTDTTIEEPQRTVFFFLPSTGLLSQQEFADVSRHEVIHALADNSTLSMENEPPSQAELAQWTGACDAFRSLAIEETESSSRRFLQIMENMEGTFTDPAVAQTFDDVARAVEQGDLNIHQPRNGDTADAYASEVPECQVIGPWESFIRLLDERGVSTDSFLNDQSHTDPAMDSFWENYSDLRDEWSEVVADRTIYSAFTEYKYNIPSGAAALGHPQDNWDELIASTTNVAVEYPEELRRYIGRMDETEAQAAKSLIDASLNTLTQLYPDSSYQSFNDLLEERRRTILG